MSGHPYQYVIVRCVPRVDRGECVNVGVVLYAQSAGFLQASFALDEARLLALFPDLDLAAVRASLTVVCEVCEGRRFDASVLEYKLGGKDISDVFEMSIAEAEAFFGSGEAKTPLAHKVLQRLVDVGLGYVKLGQPLNTLSGGERQRIKLAAQMGDKGDVYVLDEPTTGLLRKNQIISTCDLFFQSFIRFMRCLTMKVRVTGISFLAKHSTRKL